MKREEKDYLGSIEVDENKLWGSQTQRTLNNFKIGTEKIPMDLLYSYAIVKKACARANNKLGFLSDEKNDLISEICDEIIDKKYDEHFNLPVWQAGAATPVNMNVNELISNIGSLKKNHPIGSKKPIHPNDDVNMSQSTNDTLPSSIHISAYFLIRDKLIPALISLKEGLDKKIKEFDKIIKVGRTHLMDALPITLGQEFSVYRSQLNDAIEALESNLSRLLKIPIGGTAVGTGMNTHKDYDQLVIKEIAKITNEQFILAPNKFQSISANDDIILLTGVLKMIAINFFKMATDISHLASGPRCSIGELMIPANEPGSSIMPGKNNPSQCESMRMVALQVMGNEKVISLASSLGNFQLNVLRPVMIHNFFQSVNLLADSAKSFLKHCLVGIKPNLERIQENLDNNLMLATALNKELGYDVTVEIVKKAEGENISLKQATLELNLLDEKRFDEIINYKKMVGLE